MEFLLLGPLEVRHEGRVLPLGRRRAERCLLGLLLLEAGHLISIDRLADLLWDDMPPDNTRALLQTHVSRLRSLLDPDRDGRHGVRLVGRRSGYELHVDSDAVDALRFRSAVSAAEGLADPGARASLLREALTLWRGPLLADAATDRLRDRVGTGLAELRLHAWEVCMEAEIESGRHRDVIAEITELVAANPLRERMIRALMLALHRDGRQSDAIDTYNLAKTRITDLTGLDPGHELTRLRDSILRDEPAPVVAERRQSGPQQLPPDVAHFVGREDELAELIRLGTRISGYARVAAIHGAGGCGKSALAIRAGHRLSGSYLDGQLYVDLQGSTPGMAPLHPRVALQRFFRALGVDGRDVPRDLGEATGMFRDMSANRSLLILLDNAADAAQVKPLLPSSRHCFVVVTSRALLSTLDNADHVQVGVLPEAEALALLGRFDRRAFDAGQRRSATEIVRRCGHLPLAIRIAGARLASHPDRTLDQAGQRLAQERATLDELEQDDLSIRSNIAVSQENLSRDSTGRAAALFQRIGLLRCWDLSQLVAAELIESDAQGAAEALNLLAEQQLLQPMDGRRYGLHDLVRLYAGEQSDALPPQVREETLARVLDFYAHAVTMAMRAMFKGSTRVPVHQSSRPDSAMFAESVDGQRWLEAEIANIVAVTREGAHAIDPAPSYVVSIAEMLRFPLYDMLFRFDELREIAENAIVAATRIGSRRGLAQAHESLAWASFPLAEFATAARSGKLALELYRESSDPMGECAALFTLGVVHKASSELDLAADYLRQAITLARQIGQPRHEANYLDNLGTVLMKAGRLEDAIDAHKLGLKIREEQEYPLGVAASHDNLGWALLAADRPEEAAGHFRIGAQIAGEVSYLALRAAALWGLGVAIHRLGDPAGAKSPWHEAIDLLTGLGGIEPEEAARLRAQAAPEMPRAIRRWLG